MKRTALSIFALITISLQLHAEKPEGEGWVSLFNGKDLSGWKPPGGDHNWQVIDGVIDYEAKGGNLVSEKSFKNYRLHIEWRLKRTAGPKRKTTLVDKNGDPILKDGKPQTVEFDNADSGIYLRGSGKSQINIWCWPCGSGQLWSFQNHKDPEVKAGAWPDENADNPVGEWNTFDVTMEGEKLTLKLNGKTIVDGVTFPGIGTEGPLVLQHHGGKKGDTWNNASALIQFRNIWIKEL